MTLRSLFARNRIDGLGSGCFPRRILWQVTGWRVKRGKSPSIPTIVSIVLAGLIACSSPKLQAGEEKPRNGGTIIRSISRVTSLPLILDRFSFGDSVFASHATFPHRVVFPQPTDYPEVKYISVRGGKGAADLIVIALRDGADRNEYFSVTGNSPVIVPSSSISQSDPAIAYFLKRSLLRASVIDDNRIILPIARSLNVIANDAYASHHIEVTQQVARSYISGLLDRASRDLSVHLEAGCILYPQVFEIRWDKSIEQGILVLRSSAYNGKEIYSYTEDRSCSDDLKKVHNSRLDDFHNSGLFIPTKYLIYASNHHDVFSFPITWLDPSDANHKRIIVDVDKIAPALDKRLSEVLATIPAENSCKQHLYDCIQNIVDEAILSLTR